MGWPTTPEPLREENDGGWQQGSLLQKGEDFSFFFAFLSFWHGMCNILGMKTITKEEHLKMLQRNCNKGKHRLRINDAGVCFCVICGLLSNTNVAEKLKEEDKLNII